MRILKNIRFLKNLKKVSFLSLFALGLFLASCPQPTDDAPIGPGPSNPGNLDDPNNPGNPSDPNNPDPNNPNNNVDTFVPVTSITGAPTGGVKGSPVDLSGASVVPSNATNKTIVWSIKDQGRAAIAWGMTDKTFIPDLAGTAILTASVADGKAPGQAYTQDFNLTIADNHVPVTAIRGVPASGIVGTAISLANVIVEPENATDKGISWSAAADSQVAGVMGEAGFIPQSAGTLKLTASIAQGKSGTEAYTQTFAISVAIIPVQSISGVPVSGVAGTAIDLSGATALPANATGRTIVWSVAADSVAGTLDAASFTPHSAGTARLTATVAHGASWTEPYTQTFALDVVNPPPTNSVYLAPTEANSGETAIAGAEAGFVEVGNGAVVNLSALEQPRVYFTAAKEAAQTITVGGANAALVSQAAAGTVDGSAASGELSVFTVDTSDFDLMFAGGSRSFTLTVSEPQKSPLTFTVNVDITANLTGVAVFKVTRPAGDQGITVYTNPADAEAWAKAGAIARIPGLKKWSLQNGELVNEDASCLLDALVWADQNAETGEEYLIRVEQREELPSVYLQFGEMEWVTLRLRGYSEERRILHNKVLNSPSKNNQYGNTTAHLQNFFSFSSSPVTAAGPCRTNSLHLEKHITFEGYGTGRTTTSGGTLHYQNLIGIGANCRLVMLEGSKITNFYDDSTYNYYPLRFYGGNSAGTAPENMNSDASFYMYGGTITGNYSKNLITLNAERGTAYTGPVVFVQANVSGQQKGNMLRKSVFFKYGGAISGNYGGSEGSYTVPNDYVWWGQPGPSRLLTLIEDVRTYALPVFN